MALDPKLFLHDSDKAAMTALKAIPGFAQVMKAFMKIWNEQVNRLINTSTYLKLGPNQMAKYYNMLLPICDKLGIDVPDMYIKYDVTANAYTWGDTKPYIVLHSGLFETMPDELISSVIAHECGHIVCRHALYTTMGEFILNSASYFTSGLGNIAIYPLQLAFAYWMRCSEFSADRVAIICDGTSEKVMEFCMRFAGYDKDIKAEASLEAFMQQAEEYKTLVNDSKWNKTLEFLMFQNNSHPLNAVRAYEAREWANSERFKNIMDYLNSPTDYASLKLPVLLNPKKYVGKNALDLQTELMGKGFPNISMVRTTEKMGKEKSGNVVSVSVNGNAELDEDYFSRDSVIVITYYEDKTDEEIALEHPGEIMIEDYKEMIGKPSDAVIDELKNLGFMNIVLKNIPLPKFGKKGKENCVVKVSFDGKSQVDKKSWFSPNAVIEVYSYISAE